MISHFFIDRPIFATVVSILITLTGAIAVFSLPIAQYPQITPPAVQVTIAYPGASAQIVADTVAAPIEQQVNGVEGMLYMFSQMGNDGTYSLTVTFEVGTDLNTALVMVQNRVALAMPLLPTSVQNEGITIRKRTPDILMVINFYSPNGRYDNIYLSNFATINVRDELLRLEGVSDIIILGERDYSIRVWLDPQKMASYSLNAGDVAAAIRNQNLDVPAGQIGQPPVPRGQPFTVPLDTLGRLSIPGQYADIIVKADAGTPVPPTTAVPAPVPGVPGLPTPVSTGAPPAPSTSVRTPIIPTALGSLTAPINTAISQMANNTTAPNQQGTGNSSSGGLSGVTTGGGATTGGGSTATGGATTGGGASSGSALSSGVATASSGMQEGTATDASAAGGQGLGGGTTGQMVGLSIDSQSVAAATAVAGVTQGPRRPSAAIVRVRDVGRVELGAQNYQQTCMFDGHLSVGMAIFQLPGTNALDVAERIRGKMKELESRFPEGIAYQAAYDTTPFIRESVADVVQTLFEAVLLVGLVVLAFLQNWRTALIPMISVPVAIVGTFAVMAVVGFSLNNISLFGLVLAIGIVVDDAIVVVENVERWLDRGLAPRDAARKAMEEVTGPVIAVALVLCAVFVPCAFIGGITGRFFRQFALTIAASTVFSAVNSLTLSPALAAILLRPRGARRDPLTWLLDTLFGWFFRGFNAVFGAGTAGYAWAVGRLVRVHVVVLLVYAALLALTYEVFAGAPKGFVPQQDQGRILAGIQLPDAASLERTQDVLAQIEKLARRQPGVAHTVTVAGFSFVQAAYGSNFGSMFVTLDPFEKRRGRPELSDEAIMARLRPIWARQVKDAQVLAFGAPPIPGLSVAGGFKFMVEDRGGLGLGVLEQQTDALIRKLQKRRELVGVSTQFRSTTPQLFMDIDRAKVASLGVTIEDANQTLEIYLGSLYVTNMNAFGRHWQVNIQAEGQFRNRVDDLNLLKVRNNQGQMVPLGTLVNVREIGGPIFVNRYNLFSATAVTGNLLPGASSGDVINAVDALANDTLALSMSKEWTELMFVQIRAGNTAMYVFALGVVCVFLALAALYESWSLPLAVILVVPLCLLFSVLGVLYTHNSVNIFVQIGLVVLVGLACKNAILIVEFAKRLRQRGRPRLDATQEASRLRLRPILMTSFAFILGVVPLVIANGAGAEMRRSLGTAVFTGMLGLTLFGIFLTPVFFYVIQGLGETRLWAAAATRWIVTTMVGGLAGAGVGLALSRIGWGGPLWAPLVGGCAGVLGALLVQGIHGRLSGTAPPAQEKGEPRP
jgi:multidrug efflux pump